MVKFDLVSRYKPTGDQAPAIEKLVQGIKEGKKHQVLLGATGTGKTFTVSNVIQQVGKTTLVMVHNKTLAGQLYSELKEFFPNNRVEYFISNFDYYQPEAYMPKSDTYIDKSSLTNLELDMMRSSAINSLLEREDTIVVASVAAIYGAIDPAEYRHMSFKVTINESTNRNELIKKLIDAQFKRNDLDLAPGSFRVRGDCIEIAPSSTNEFYIRIDMFDDEIERIVEVDPITGKSKASYKEYPIFPAYSYATSRERILRACETIEAELKDRLEYFTKMGKPLEYERLDNRTRNDVDSLKELGICPGVENYSRHINGMQPGQTPYTLFDYFPKDFLLIVDESHVSLPQVRGMYNGDRSRKETLVEYGFRLPSALDNRPLRFEEFEDKINQAIFVSATPGDYELEKVNGDVAEQIIRPTGLLDPIIEVKPTKHQIDDIMEQIDRNVKNNERVLITTLTIRMAEDLTDYLKKRNVKVAYLHSETKTLERTKLIYELRKGKYDVLVGINLLREGLDIPEVSLILILDADKEGFLRSERSLIQIVGRAARNSNGRVIMYGDTITQSMQRTIDETARRRAIQDKFNKEHGITPKTIIKEVKEPITIMNASIDVDGIGKSNKKMTKKEKDRMISQLEKEMKQAAKELDFERAVELRDLLFAIKNEE